METIIQWNCWGFRASREEMELLCFILSPVALCLQEIKSKEEKVINMKGYAPYVKIPDPSNPVGGVAILVDKQYPQSSVDLNTDLQAVAVQITINSPVTLYSIYLPPGQRVSYNSLKDLVTQLPSPFIIMGDFNAHNTIWGSNKLDDRGRLVERLIDKCSLCIFNSKAPTYLHPATGTYSSIDLSLCHLTLFVDFKWRVHSDLCGSDHFPIILETEKINENRERHASWKVRKSDWDEFGRLCSQPFFLGRQ